MAGKRATATKPVRRPVKERPHSPNVFEARFSGLCGTCDGRFQVGTLVRYNENNDLVEDECPETEGEGIFTEEEQARARADMCGRCFMVHNGECL